MLVTAIAIVVSVYHDTPVGRLQFRREDGTIEESNLYSMEELNNILSCWRTYGLRGSFAIGTRLSHEAAINLSTAA